MDCPVKFCEEGDELQVEISVDDLCGLDLDEREELVTQILTERGFDFRRHIVCIKSEIEAESIIFYQKKER